jgi:diguanylate cyclase (GGDEF)-like protein/PAS domain S-box-containing protein
MELLSALLLAANCIAIVLIYRLWKTRKQMQLTEAQFKVMTDAAPVMMWIADSHGRMHYFNRQWLAFTGRTLDDEIEISCKACFHPDDIKAAVAIYEQAFKNQMPCSLEYRLVHHSGFYHWILENANPYWDANGEFKGFIGSCTDITEQKNASEKMQLTAHVFEHSIQGIMITDAAQRIIMVNPAFTELTGYSLDEIINKTPDFLNSGTHSTDFYLDISRSLKAKKYWQGEIWSRRKDGELFLEDLAINAVLDGKGKAINYIGIFTDITQRKLNEEHYQHLAHYDPLTDLPNRTLLTDRIGQALAQAQRQHHKVAVLFIDLNKFKPINDELGHHIGDLLLKEVAQRLKNCVRSEDTVARLGGDEFVVLFPSIHHHVDVIKTVERIIAALSIAYQLESHLVTNSPSIGIAISPEHGNDMKTLLKNADAAMYRAKTLPPPCYAFYQS